jgi:hypothetical protein
MQKKILIAREYYQNSVRKNPIMWVFYKANTNTFLLYKIKKMWWLKSLFNKSNQEPTKETIQAMKAWDISERTEEMIAKIDEMVNKTKRIVKKAELILEQKEE